MSEIGGEDIKPISKEQKGPQREQGIKPAETLGAPENKEPSLRQKMSRRINSILSDAGIRNKSTIADKLIHDSAIDQVEVKKGEYRFNVHGNKDVVRLLRGELPQEQTENAVLGIEVDSGAQGGVVSTAEILEIYDSGVFQKVKEVQLYCTSVGDVVGAYVAADKGVWKDGIRKSVTAEKAAEMFWTKNCETEVDDRGITRGKFVRLPKKDGPVAQLKALMEAGPKSKDIEKAEEEKGNLQKRTDVEKLKDLIGIKRESDEQIMDTDWAIDNVEYGENKLDVEALANSKIKVNVFLMNAESGEGKWFNLNEAAKVGSERVFKILRAGCMPPGASGESVEIDGKKWADGAYAKSGNKFNEMNESCTHRLRLKNFPEGKRPPSIVNKIVGLIAEHRYENYSKEVGHLIRSQNVVKEHEDALLDQEITGEEMTAVVQIPKDGKGVDSLSIDSEEIYGMYKEVRKYTKDLLDPSKPLRRPAGGLQTAGEELKAMDITSGKNPEIKPVETSKSGVESSSDNADTGTKKGEEAKAKTFALREHEEEFALKDKVSEKARQLDEYLPREQTDVALAIMRRLNGLPIITDKFGGNIIKEGYRGNDIHDYKNNKDREINYELLEEMLKLVKELNIPSSHERAKLGMDGVKAIKQQLTFGDKVWMELTNLSGSFSEKIHPPAALVVCAYKRKLEAEKRAKAGQGATQNLVQEKKPA